MRELICLVLAFAIFLAGCDGREKEKAEALAEAAEARAQFAKAQVSLAKTESERDNLKSELAAVIQAHYKLQEQVGELAKGHDEALAKVKATEDEVENLTGQLKDQMEKASKLQDQVKKLQATIEQLQEKPKDVKVPTVPQL